LQKLNGALFTVHSVYFVFVVRCLSYIMQHVETAVNTLSAIFN